MPKLLKKGIILDPRAYFQEEKDILINEEKIIKIADSIEVNELREKYDSSFLDKLEIFELEKNFVLPGLIDLHTHLREPGYEEKETIRTGCEAAAAGGFTQIACMANTKPVADNPATIEFIKSQSRKAAVKVWPVGSITKDMQGENLAEIGFLSKAGVKAISDDGKTVMDSDIMRRAMEYAAGFNMLVIDHCEDLNLVGEGVMNEGYYSTILGLKPIPAAAEEVIIARNIILSELTDCPIHIAHLSTARGVEMVAEAKEKGISITAETTPHHLILTDKAVVGYDPNTRVNPPLRSSEDREALRQGIKEGIIDAVATDHAPHTFEDKLGEFDQAANGISGLDTSLSLLYDRLVDENILNWSELLEAMVYKPAEILKLQEPGIREGKTADLAVFDPDKKWKIESKALKSKGKNTPFLGEKLKGKVKMTLVDGKLVYDNRGGQNEIIY